jgi:peroxiredoxin
MRNQSDTLAVGDLAPPFTLNDQKGRPWSLEAALPERSVLLAFHRGTW